MLNQHALLVLSRNFLTTECQSYGRLSSCTIFQNEQLVYMHTALCSHFYYVVVFLFSNNFPNSPAPWRGYSFFPYILLGVRAFDFYFVQIWRGGSFFFQALPKNWIFWLFSFSNIYFCYSLPVRLRFSYICCSPFSLDLTIFVLFSSF